MTSGRMSVQMCADATKPPVELSEFVVISGSMITATRYNALVMGGFAVALPGNYLKMKRTDAVAFKEPILCDFIDKLY